MSHLRNLFSRMFGRKRNTSDSAALEQMGERISRLNHKSTPADSHFEQRLLSELLSARRTPAPMSRFSLSRVPWNQLFRAPQFKFGLASLLLVALVSTTLWYSFGLNGPDSPFSGFSKLLISPAYAADNFTLVAEQADSTGVDGNTTYLLTSKEALDTGLVRDHLRLEPTGEFTLESLNPTQWRIRPSQAANPNTLVKVALATSYVDDQGKSQERDYSWAFQVKDGFKVLSSIPRQAATNVPLTTGIEVTLSHDNVAEFEKFFSVSPAVPGKFERHGRTFVYVPTQPLQPRTVYTVTIAKELSLIGSTQTLSANYTVAFETQDRPGTGADGGAPWFQSSQDMYEFDPGHAPIIQLFTGSTPVPNLDVTVFRVDSREAFLKLLNQRDKFPWWAYSKNDQLYDTTNLPVASSFSVALRDQDYIQYAEFPTPLPPGRYIIEMRNGNVRDQVIAQVTTLTAYTNVARNSTMVWVNSVATGRPVAGATIRVAEQNYQTTGDGTAVFVTPAALIDDLSDTTKYERVYAEVTANGESLIMPVSSFSSRLGYSLYNPQASAGENYWHYLYTDRPRYQSEDVIKFWGLIKPRAGQLANEPATLTLTKEGYVDYYYNPITITQQPLTISPEGTFIGEIPLHNLKADYYTLEVRIGKDVIERKYLEVRPYIKPAYQLELSTDRTAAFTGETVTLTAQASFFEGTPVPNLALVLDTPKGPVSLTTDPQGKATAAYTLAYTDCPSNFSCWPRSQWFSVRPAQAELAEILASASVAYYGPKLWLDSNIAYPEPGVAQATFTAKHIDLNKITGTDSWNLSSRGDAPAAGARVEGKVTKITHLEHETGTAYNFITKQSYKTYRYEIKEEEVATFSGTTDAAGQYVHRQAVEPKTSYRIVARIYDAKNQPDLTTLMAYYYNGVTANQYVGDSNYYHFDLPENTTYSVGDTVNARYLLGSDLLPSGQGSRYLFAQYQNGYQEHTVTDAPVYTFPFEGRDIPNVNLLGVYFTGTTYVVTESGFFGQSPALKLDDRKLNITIQPDKARYQPGQPARVDVRVTDQNGRPVSAEVNLNLVDEAYYVVANDTASPLTTIYARVGTGSLFSRSTHQQPSNQYGGAEKGGCFAKGTLITLADGSTKPIEAIVVGDKIQTLADPVSGKRAIGEVTEVFRHVVTETLVINDDLRVTPEHLVYSNFAFRPAGDLKIGDWLLAADGQKVEITSITQHVETIPVFNFRVDPQHTYIAGGFYVHNDKGGGPREFFVDAALFRSIKTGANGQGSVAFDLPDNVTSWRLTAQAIGDNLFVGAVTAKLPVSLPVFADVSIAPEYLVADQPVISFRAFGNAFAAGDTATFTVQAPTLGVERSAPISSPVFTPAYFSLPPLQLGSHSLTVNLDSAKGKDAVRLPTNVIASRLQKQIATNAVLTTNSVVTTPDNQPAVVVLSDIGQNQLYPTLQSLAWAWGDRVDQALARRVSRQLLNQYYAEDVTVSPFAAYLYQAASGGLTLLPYSSEDVELSAKLAAVGRVEFDQTALQQYLFGILEGQSSNVRQVSAALYGLGALQQPVLPRVQAWLQRTDLAPIDRLYSGLALYQLGDHEGARVVYRQLLDQFGQTKAPYHILKISDDENEILQATTLVATLAADLHQPERDGFWRYVSEAPRTNVLLNLESLAYVQATLPQLKPGPVNVTYRLNNVEHSVRLTGGETHAFQLDPSQFSQLAFTQVEGDAGLSIRWTRPASDQELATDPDTTLRRVYYVNGRPATTFAQGDTVEVRLYPNFTSKSLNGSYQITDLLPSGLLPTTQLGQGGRSSDCHVWHPYNVDGQRVIYQIEKSWRSWYCGDYISYFARVRAAGTYVAEPAIIQSFANPEFIGRSAPEMVTIR